MLFDAGYHNPSAVANTTPEELARRCPKLSSDQMKLLSVCRSLISKARAYLGMVVAALHQEMHDAESSLSTAGVTLDENEPEFDAR